MQTLRINIDAVLPEQIYYDPAVKRYRYKGGSPDQPIRGTFISRSDALKLQRDFLTDVKARFLALTPRIMAGEIGVYSEAGVLLKQIHLSNAVLAAGGFDRLTQSDLGSIGSILKKQYYAGKSEDGKPFGLKHLFKDVQNGTVSAAQLRNRLDMYAESGEISGSYIKQSRALLSGLTTMRRLLGITDNHCAECVDYAGRGWVKIGDLPFPKQQCSCRSRCLCSVTYGDDSKLL